MWKMDKYYWKSWFHKVQSLFREEILIIQKYIASHIFRASIDRKYVQRVGTTCRQIRNSLFPMLHGWRSNLQHKYKLTKLPELTIFILNLFYTTRMDVNDLFNSNSESYWFISLLSVIFKLLELFTTKESSREF